MKFLSALFLMTLAFAHEGHHDAPAEPVDEETAETLKEIGDDYEASIKPIFQRACYDCHSSTTNYPWYYKVPGVKQLIDGDIKEAREHIDMSNGFPFQGHGTPVEDLEAIIDTIKEGDMPPLKYKVMHPSSKLTDAEKTLVKDWAADALIFL
jgi:hypothetical protein